MIFVEEKFTLSSVNSLDSAKQQAEL